MDERGSLSRRCFLAGPGLSLGALALADLAAAQTRSAAPDARHVPAGLPHHPPKAKNVIYIQICGGPSQLDLFDHKPQLSARSGQEVPESLIEGQRFAFVRGKKKFLGTPYKFARHGQCGAPVCEHLPHLANIVDDLTFVKSMQTDQFNHGPAQIFLNTGSEMMGRPSLGSWLAYGLGGESKNLPSFVVLVPGQRNSGGKGMWSNGFLPARFQGVEFRTTGEPVRFVGNPAGVDAAARRDTIEAVQLLDQLRLDRLGDPEIAGAIASYEMAFQMQTSVPELMRIDEEPKSVRDLYGLDVLKTGFARSCLLARRLVERGVRFVQICYEGEFGKAIWDSHGDTRRASLEVGLPYLCQQADQPTAGLIQDLKSRGMLDETLVVWGGEFGRTPMNEDRPGAEKGYTGRDHWNKTGTLFLAGGGVRPGTTVGTTDELGFFVAEDPVHVHDLNATILHLLGIDHKRLTFRFQGRDFRLTDVHGNVVRKLLA